MYEMPQKCPDCKGLGEKNEICKSCEGKGVTGSGLGRYTNCKSCDGKGRKKLGVVCGLCRGFGII
jgi:DnaJ-class molecular chaperone